VTWRLSCLRRRRWKKQVLATQLTCCFTVISLSSSTPRSRTTSFSCRVTSLMVSVRSLGSSWRNTAREPNQIIIIIIVIDFPMFLILLSKKTDFHPYNTRTKEEPHFKLRVKDHSNMKKFSCDASCLRSLNLFHPHVYLSGSWKYKTCKLNIVLLCFVNLILLFDILLLVILLVFVYCCVNCHLVGLITDNAG